MITLRLFGQARSRAGTGSIDINASTLREVLDFAATTFGPEFEEVAAFSVVWVNGEQTLASQNIELSPGDEVALLPPVAGG